MGILVELTNEFNNCIRNAEDSRSYYYQKYETQLQLLKRMGVISDREYAIQSDRALKIFNKEVA